MSGDMGADKATQLTRKFLEDNYGNINMLLYRIENVVRNSHENIYKVVCSILPSIGSSERVYYLLKIDIAKEMIIDVLKGKEEKQPDGKMIIKLQKVEVEEPSQ